MGVSTTNVDLLFVNIYFKSLEAEMMLSFLQGISESKRSLRLLRLLITGCESSKIYPLNMAAICNIQVQISVFSIAYFYTGSNTGLKSGVRGLRVYCGSACRPYGG